MRRAHHAVFSGQMLSTGREEAIVLGLSAVWMAHGCTRSPGQGTQMQSQCTVGFCFFWQGGEKNVNIL